MKKTKPTKSDVIKFGNDLKIAKRKIVELALTWQSYYGKTAARRLFDLADKFSAIQNECENKSWSMHGDIHVFYGPTQEELADKVITELREISSQMNKLCEGEK